MKLELSHIQKTFPDGTPIKDLNAVINDGDVIAVIGPSGTGKSTFLRCINMLDPPTSGTITVDGIDITKSKANFEKVRGRMGMVFQSFNLFGHLTAVENVMFALRKIKRMSKQEAYDIAMEQLAAVGLEAHALKYPEELSGGQKQRVSIARTLAMDPELILLDEPTSALDPTMVREVEAVIMKLAKTGKTIMIVTHEMRLAKAISNRVFYLDRGGLYEEGTPEQIFNNPQRERTRAFVNNLKVLKYKLNTNTFDYGDFSEKFNGFIENNDLDEDTATVLKKAEYSVFGWIVPDYLTLDVNMSVLSEYSPETHKTSVVIFCSNSEATERIGAALRNIMTSVEISDVSDKDFIKKITCEI